MRIWTLTLSILLLMTLAACANGDQDSPENLVTEIPNTQETTFEETAVPGETAIRGQIISSTNRSSPIKQVEVRLAKVYWSDDESDGAFLIDEATSPVTFTDDRGRFVFRNPEPRDYVIIVGDLYGQNVIVSNQEGSAKIYTLESDIVLDVGQLVIDLSATPIPQDFDAYPALSFTPEPDNYP
jgi:hypothetical protein